MVPTGDVYQFNITSSTAGYAFVTSGSTSFYTRVNYISRAEASIATTNCGSDISATGKTVNGTFTAVGSTDRATVSLANSYIGLRLPGSTFQFNAVPTGLWDVIAYRHNDAAPASDRMLIRRDQDIPDGGSLALIDFNGSEAVAATSAQITLSGAAANELVTQSMYYATGTACSSFGFLYQTTSTGPNAVAYGWPSTAPQRATDLHLMQFTSFNGANGRGVTQATHSLTSRVLNMLPYPTATVTSSGTSYKRMQFVAPVAPDYDNGFVIYYDAAAAHNVVVALTSGYLAGAASGTFAMPDLTGTPGFLPSWEPAVGALTQWSVNLSTATWPRPACSDGAIARYVTVTGIN